LEVTACQEVARGLGILDKVTFGAKFGAIREAGKMYDEWKGRFDAQDRAKTLAELQGAGNTTGGEEEMAVDEGSVVGMSRRSRGRQVRKTPTMEVTISKAPTPVSGLIFGFI